MRSVSSRRSSRSLRRPWGADKMASSFRQTGGMCGSTTVRRSCARRGAERAEAKRTDMAKEKKEDRSRENRRATGGILISESVVIPHFGNDSQWKVIQGFYFPKIRASSASPRSERSDHCLAIRRCSCSLALPRGPAFLGVLRVFGMLDMALHEPVCFGGVSGADGAIDFAMDVRGVFERSAEGRRLAPAVIERGGYGFHQGGEDGIAGGTGDGAMKAHVVNKIFFGIVNGGIHFRDFFGEKREVFLLATFGRERGHLA